MDPRWIVLPIIIPLLTALIALFAPNKLARRWVVRTGLILNLGVAVFLFTTVLQDETVLVTQAGAWQAPFGITLAIDPLSGLMLSVTAILTLTVGIYSDLTIDKTREDFGFLPIMAFMLMGINLAFVTGDIFNLYVAFEIMLTASFGLLILGDRESQIRGGMKYMVINLLSSTVFVVAISLTYATLGTLNIAHLIYRVQELDTDPSILTIVAALYLVGFSIKAAAFPFHFWLPASYHTPPVAVSAIFGGLLTKVGIYAMIRVLVFIFHNELDHLQFIWLTISGLTMLTGVFGALYQREIRRIFSFLIISHVGFIMMGISFDTRLGLTAAIFYLAHHMIVKTALFMAIGIMENTTHTKDVHQMGGLLKQHPILTVLFFIAALALSGIPPLSGFFAKFALLSAAWQAEQYVLGVISLIVSLLTIITVMRVWQLAFWYEPPELDGRDTQEYRFVDFSRREKRHLVFPIAVLVALSIGIGFFANASYELADTTAEQILNPTRYVEAVLGKDFHDKSYSDVTLSVDEEHAK